jgi:Uma2 family endonuclease
MMLDRILLAMRKPQRYHNGMTANDLMTAEELLRRQPPHKRSELVNGRMIVREPAGYRHGRVVADLTYRLQHHVKADDLGVVYAAETGFLLARDPDTVRAPDVAFVTTERLPEPEPTGFAELAPDLAVEVLSPDDRPGEVLAKVGDWLAAGTRLVWIVDPVRRQVRVYRSDGSQSTIAGSDLLDGEDVVPGFSFPADAIF